MESLNITKFANIDPNYIQKVIEQNNGRIIIEYLMSSINVTNSPIDIVDDYIEALYFSEELGKYALNIIATMISEDTYKVFCKYEILVSDIKQFVIKAKELFDLFYEDYEDEDILIERQEILNEFESTIETRIFLCPELADDYYANLVNAAYFAMDSEFGEGFLKKEYLKFPERKFRFWESACGKAIKQPFYASSDCWIIPKTTDLEVLLSKYSGLSNEESYEIATFFSINHYSYLINQNALVFFPFSAYMRAKECADILYNDAFQNAPTILSEVLTYSTFDDFMLEKYNIDLQSERIQPKYFLSSSGEAIIVEEGNLKYLFFPDRVNNNKGIHLYEEFSKVNLSLAQYAGISPNITLNWDLIDDEKFENLCYDILYHSPKFDNTTIRKMGKSRSRDGGRDISIYTRERLGQSKKHFIFQCKLTKIGTSLTTQKVKNITDTIIQYKAQGYGLMTSVVIDSTLYDRVDAICENFNVESNHWSLLEIERFIARHPNLKERHF